MQGVVCAGVIDERQFESLWDREEQRFQDLRDNMLRGHEIDVVAPALLELQHAASEFFGAQARITHRRTLTDVEVLAENTFEVAVSEKDGARATISSEAVLFTKVGEGTGDNSLAS